MRVKRRMEERKENADTIHRDEPRKMGETEDGERINEKEDLYAWDKIRSK